MSVRESIKTLLKGGCSVQYGQLSICDLRHFVHSRENLDKIYQVDCNDSKFVFTQIYANLNTAIDKFCLIKGIIDGTIQRN
jgi:hypothetical protein